MRAGDLGRPGSPQFADRTGRANPPLADRYFRTGGRGAVARYATCHSIEYDDAVAVLIRIERDTFAETNGLLADER